MRHNIESIKKFYQEIEKNFKKKKKPVQQSFESFKYSYLLKLNYSILKDFFLIHTP